MKHTAAPLLILLATLLAPLPVLAQDDDFDDEDVDELVVEDEGAPTVLVEDVRPEYLMDANDFDLETVAGLVRDSKAENASDLESIVNDDNGINNVDLDGDGFVDHVLVREVRGDDGITFEFIGVPSSRPGNIDERVVVARLHFQESIEAREITVVADYPEYVEQHEVYVYEYTADHPYYVHRHHHPNAFFWWLYTPGRTVWVYAYDPWVYHAHHHVYVHHDLVTARARCRSHYGHRPIASSPHSHGHSARPTAYAPRQRPTPAVHVDNGPRPAHPEAQRSNAQPVPVQDGNRSRVRSLEKRPVRATNVDGRADARRPVAAEASGAARTPVDPRKARRVDTSRRFNAARASDGARSLDGARAVERGADVSSPPANADAPRKVRTIESARTSRKGDARLNPRTPAAPSRAKRQAAPAPSVERVSPSSDGASAKASRDGKSSGKKKASKKKASKKKAKATSRTRKASRRTGRVRRMR